MPSTRNGCGGVTRNVSASTRSEECPNGPARPARSSARPSMRSSRCRCGAATAVLLPGRAAPASAPTSARPMASRNASQRARNSGDSGDCSVTSRLSGRTNHGKLASAVSAISSRSLSRPAGIWPRSRAASRRAISPVQGLPVGAGGDVGGPRVGVLGQLLPGHQPHPARVVPEHPSEEREHLRQPVAQVEEARHVREQPFVAAVHAVADHRVEERRLALEVLVDRADVHPRPLGDRVDARPGEALRRELRHRPGEHHLARAGGVAAPRLGAVGARRVGRRHAADTNMRNTCFQYSLQR